MVKKNVADTVAVAAAVAAAADADADADTTTTTNTTTTTTITDVDVDVAADAAVNDEVEEGNDSPKLPLTSTELGVPPAITTKRVKFEKKTKTKMHMVTSFECNCANMIFKVAKDYKVLKEVSLTKTLKSSNKFDKVRAVTAKQLAHLSAITDDHLEYAAMLMLRPNNMTEVIIRNHIVKHIPTAKVQRQKSISQNLLESEWVNNHPYYRQCMPVVSCEKDEIDGVKVISPHNKKCCLDGRIERGDTSFYAGTPLKISSPLTLPVEEYIKLKKAKKQKEKTEIDKIWNDVKNELTGTVKQILNLEEGDELKNNINLVTSLAFDVRADLKLENLKHVYRTTASKNRPLCIQLCQHSDNCEALNAALENIKNFLTFSLKHYDIKGLASMEISSEQSEKLKKAIFKSETTEQPLTVILSLNPYDPLKCLSHRDLITVGEDVGNTTEADFEKLVGIGFVTSSTVLISSYGKSDDLDLLLSSNTRIMTFKPPTIDKKATFFQLHNFYNFPMNKCKIGYHEDPSFKYHVEINPLSAMYYDNPVVNRSVFGSSNSNNLSISLLSNHSQINAPLDAFSTINNAQIIYAIDNLLALWHKTKKRDLVCGKMTKDVCIEIRAPSYYTLDGCNVENRHYRLREMLTANLPSTHHLESTKMSIKLLLLQIVDRRYSAETVSSHFGNLRKIFLENVKKEAVEAQADVITAVAATHNYSNALKNMSMWFMKLSQELYLFLNGDFILNLTEYAHQLTNMGNHGCDELEKAITTIIENDKIKKEQLQKECQNNIAAATKPTTPATTTTTTTTTSN